MTTSVPNIHVAIDFDTKRRLISNWYWKWSITTPNVLWLPISTMRMGCNNLRVPYSPGTARTGPGSVMWLRHYSRMIFRFLMSQYLANENKRSTIWQLCRYWWHRDLRCHQWRQICQIDDLLFSVGQHGLKKHVWFKCLLWRLYWASSMLLRLLWRCGSVAVYASVN